MRKVQRIAKMFPTITFIFVEEEAIVRSANQGGRQGLFTKAKTGFYMHQIPTLFRI